MQVSPSRFAVTGAVIIALVASAGDALSASPSYQFPDWIRLSMTLPGFAGAYCAPIVSGALGLGPTVKSAPLGFALSAPINFALYWLLFRVSASVILFLFPAKQGKPTKTSADPRANREFDGQA